MNARHKAGHDGILRRLLFGAFFLLGRRKDFHRAARLLDRRDGGFGGAVNLDIQLGLDFAAAEQTHANAAPRELARLIGDALRRYEPK